MALYNHNNPMLGSATIEAKLDNYIKESIAPVEGESLYEEMFYRMDVKKKDGVSGRPWSASFVTSKPHGPGGYAQYTDEMWATVATPGIMGITPPNDQVHTVSTRFNFASIGRTIQDQLNDTNNFYDAVKAEEFGSHIREQQKEEIKSTIFKKGIKHYAGGAASESEMTIDKVLTYGELDQLVTSIDDFEVEVLDGMQRVSQQFVNAVKAVTGTATGADAVSQANVIDFEAFQAAQKAYETGAKRKMRWNTPRFVVRGLEKAENYKSVNVGSITLDKPNYKDLFTKKQTQETEMLVIVSKYGFEQLWKDPEFREQVEVSGYKHEAGTSGRFDKHLNSRKVINIQGMLIYNIGQDYIHGSLASEGIYYDKSVVAGAAGDVELNAALVATPGYNFITESSDFGTRTTYKPLGQTDMIDRMGQYEFMYTMFTWGISVGTPSAFNMLIHAGKGYTIPSAAKSAK